VNHPPVISPDEKKTTEVITANQFTEIAEMLGKPTSDVTATVRNNAQNIVNALKTGSKLSDAKAAIENLIDDSKDSQSFQTLLKQPQDGTIGCGDIVALLKLAGVNQKDIPTVISNKAGKEKKVAVIPAAAVPVKSDKPVVAATEAVKEVNESDQSIKAVKEMLATDF